MPSYNDAANGCGSLLVGVEGELCSRLTSWGHRVAYDTMAGFLRFQPRRTTAQAMLCDSGQFEHAARDIAPTSRIPMSPDSANQCY